MNIVVGAMAAALVLLAGTRFRPRPLRLVQPLPAIERARRRRHHIPVGLCLIAAVLVAGPFAAAAVLGMAAMRPRLQAIRRDRRSVAAIASAYPDFVDLLVLSITSGCSPAQSVEILIDIVPDAIQPALAGVQHRSAVGGRFADAISDLQIAPPLGLGSIAQPLADALALADRYGTPLAPVLDRLAEEARNQRRRNAEAAARQLPIRLAFPLVGCTLPSFVLLTIVPLMAGTFSSLRGLTP